LFTVNNGDPFCQYPEPRYCHQGLTLKAFFIMYDLSILQNQSVLTMSSREIAEITGKLHKNVTPIILSLQKDQLLTAEIQLSTFEHRGNTYTVYHLNKRDSILLVARLSPEFTAALVDRWQELENKQQKQDPAAMLNDPAAMRLMLLSYVDKVIELQPKADALDLISSSADSRCIRDTAKELKIKPSQLTKYLLDNRWIYRQSRDDEKLGKVMAYQHRIDQGLIEHCSVVVEQKGQTKLATSVKITGKGFAKLSIVFAGESK